MPDFCSVKRKRVEMSVSLQTAKICNNPKNVPGKNNRQPSEKDCRLFWFCVSNTNYSESHFWASPSSSK